MWRERARACCLVLVLICTGCSNDWRTDMWFQPSRAARATPRPEPEGSVPLFARLHLEDRDDAEGLRAPPADEGAELRGQALFLDRCQSCHGPQGHGGGPVGKFFPPAPDLSYPVIVKRSDGYLYATIGLGGKSMPPMGEGLDERDRWDLVRFIRHVQASAPDGGR